MPQPEQRPNPHDTIKVIIALAAERAVLADCSVRIQCAFFKAIQEFPGILEGLLFDTNGHFPYSEDLQEIFSQLKLSGVIEIPIPPQTRLIMRPETITFIRTEVEPAIRKAIPELDEVIALICSPENPHSLLLRQPAPAPSS